jgi:hypothetical protein
MFRFRFTDDSRSSVRQHGHTSKKNTSVVIATPLISMAQSAELANAMSLPQATPAVGPEPLRPLQPLATTNLVTAQNAQNTISPLQVSTSSVNAQRTGSIQRLDEPSVEETHRSVVWGVPSTTGSEGLVPTLSSISAPPALVTSSDSRSSQPAILPQSLSAPITSPSVAPPIVVEPSRAAVSNSEQSVAASTASQQTPSFAPVTSQIASITPNATVYGTYNPSDYCEYESVRRRAVFCTWKTHLDVEYRRKHRHVKLSRFGRSI